MNIFYLDDDITTCVRYHCDKHVVKMITEYTQLLSACTRLVEGTTTRHQWIQDSKKKTQTFNTLPGETFEFSSSLNKYVHLSKKEEYLLSHAKHPDTIWLQQSRHHWLYLKSLALALYEEYKYRYNKDHAAGEIAHLLLPSDKLADIPFERPPLCMPDECKILNTDFTDNVIDSYRNYYNMKKQHIAQWKNRPIPDWFIRAED